MNKTIRLKGIDIFRGWAIVLMILFHFFFDLNHFSYIDIDIKHDNFWLSFRLIIVSMFLLTVGISLKLAHKKTINWKIIKKRTFLLGSASLLVTVGSYLQFPESWIYFGVLHFVLLSSFIILPFLNYPKVSIVLGLLILIGYFLDYISMDYLFNLLVTPLHLPLEHTEDVVRIVPWFSVVLFGSTIVTLKWHTKLFDNSFFNRENSLNSFFSLLGQNALIIYLIHQPILFSLFILLQ
jgi:uncharacterized membrane protein